MITHILKKDIALLWPIAALVAALQLCAAIPHHLRDHAAVPSQQLVVIAFFLSIVALLGTVVLVVVAMHQDPVPGVRQDWLTRPIRRRDLILAKLLFVLVMAQAPMWLVDLGAALADGIPLPAAAFAAAARNLGVFCEFALPAMMVGLITRNFVEAFVAAAIGLIAYMFIFELVLGLLLGVKVSVPGSGMGWIFDATFYAVALVGAAVTLCVQYFRRRTTLSRWLVGVGGALVIGCAFLPWHIAFGLQQALSPEPQSADPVELAFDPQRGRYPLPRGAAPYLTAALYLPLRVGGLPTGASLLLDHADLRITSIAGAPLYQGRSSISIDGLGSIEDARFESRPRSSDPEPGVYQRFYLPADVSARLATQQVRIHIDYSLTTFKPAARYSLPAVGGHETLGDLGRCATQIDAEGDDVAITCLSASHQPTCMDAYLENPASGLRNPAVHSCGPQYAPAIIAQLFPDAINRTTRELRFFDRTGFMHYPVDGSKIGDSRVVIDAFAPSAHFTRHVDTPVVRLTDLAGIAVAEGAAVPPGN